MQKNNPATSDVRDTRKESDASRLTSDRRETRSLSPKLRAPSGPTEQLSQRPQSAESSPMRRIKCHKIVLASPNSHAKEMLGSDQYPLPTLVLYHYCQDQETAMDVRFKPRGNSHCCHLTNV